MAQRFCLIANPVSGSRNRRAMVDELADGLVARGHLADVCCTAAAGDATTFARASDADVVVAIGGDGTVNEVAQGLRGRPATMGIVPAGTANVLAKELGLTRQVPAALDVLTGGRVRRLDGGVCNDERFLLMIGVGLDGAVAHAHAAARSGHTSYMAWVKPIWDTIREMPIQPLQVTVDDAPLADGIMSVVVSNVRGFGGVFEATSSAEPDDGWLDVVGLTGRSRLKWTAYLAAALTRRLHEMPGAHTARGTRIQIAADTPMPMQRDGDPFGFTPATITVEPGAVPVLVP